MLSCSLNFSILAAALSVKASTIVATIKDSTISLPQFTRDEPTPPFALLEASASASSARLLDASQMSAFATQQGTSILLNGRKFTFGGVNHYTLFYDYQVDILPFFQDLVGMQATVLRTWLFCFGRDCGATSYSTIDFWFTDVSPTGDLIVNQDTGTGVGRLDYALKVARDHGVKIIFSLSGNWDSFGGIDWFVKTWGTEKTPINHAEFYTSPLIKEKFKSYMTQVLSRVNTLTGVAYKDDPTILALELGNELRCVGSITPSPSSAFKCDSTILTAWVDEMSTFLHNLAPNHLISVGDEGFFRNGPTQYSGGVYSNLWDGSSGVDAEALARLPNIHLIGFHSWFQHWGNGKDDAKVAENTLSYLTDHAALGKKVNKPVYLGEYGTSTPQSRSQLFPPLHKLIQSTQEMAGSLMWEMQGRNNSQPCNVRLDNAGESLGMCVNSPGFQEVAAHSKVMFDRFSATPIGQRNVDHAHSSSSSSSFALLAGSGSLLAFLVVVLVV